LDAPEEKEAAEGLMSCGKWPGDKQNVFHAEDDEQRI